MHASASFPTPPTCPVHAAPLLPRSPKPSQLPSVDSVEYWRSPDKAGWLQSQSEVMKMWRRRWFVLKQGYLFRFLTPDVSGKGGGGVQAGYDGLGRWRQGRDRRVNRQCVRAACVWDLHSS